jgi:hypothetical protein
MPKASSWRVAQFDTLRLRLVKIAARVVEMKTQIKILLPTRRPIGRSGTSSSAVCRCSSPDNWGSVPPAKPSSRNLQRLSAPRSSTPLRRPTGTPTTIMTRTTESTLNLCCFR